MKLLSFDVESNGLHGEAFAVGAILYDTDTDRIALVGDGLRGLQKHNPIDDAHASAIVAGWLLTGHY